MLIFFVEELARFSTSSSLPTATIRPLDIATACALACLGSEVRSQKTAPGEWVLGFQYDDTKTAEGRYITRWDLDEVTTEHPISITHRGGHTAYTNSKALQLANIDKNTPDPEGGNIVRDEKGEPTGLLQETAVGLVYNRRHLRF